MGGFERLVESCAGTHLLLLLLLASAFGLRSLPILLPLLLLVLGGPAAGTLLLLLLLLQDGAERRQLGSRVPLGRRPPPRSRARAQEQGGGRDKGRARPVRRSEGCGQGAAGDSARTSGEVAAPERTLEKEEQVGAAGEMVLLLVVVAGLGRQRH